MQNPKHIQIKDYNYPLPDERIAKYPLENRDSSKLLIYNKGNITERVFKDLPNFLTKGDLIIFNNTKVIQARLHFQKATGGAIEVFCLEPYQPADYNLNFQQNESCSWLCMIGHSKKWKQGVLTKDIVVNNEHITLAAERKEPIGTSHLVTFSWNNPKVTFADILDYFGELPIPPYLNRHTEEKDKTTYQTVYSKIKGSVAAPTAGLHFTPEVLNNLKQVGVDLDEVTLHVGAGTFKPVKSDEIVDHDMHTEYISVRKETIQNIINHGSKVVAVGTTSVRTLESLYHIGVSIANNPAISEKELPVSQWQPYEANSGMSANDSLQAILNYMEQHHIDILNTSTQIMIAPSYQYRIVKAIVTNFHQPQSTLLLLVSAFINGDWEQIYEYALTHNFRFLSYGDSSLLIP